MCGFSFAYLNILISISPNLKIFCRLFFPEYFIGKSYGMLTLLFAKMSKNKNIQVQKF